MIDKLFLHPRIHRVPFFIDLKRWQVTDDCHAFNLFNLQSVLALRISTNEDEEVLASIKIQLKQREALL